MLRTIMVRAVGEVYVQVKVHGPRGSVVLDEVLVDTGAIHSMVDRATAELLGIVPEARGEFDIIGGSVELIHGRSFRVPVILGDQNLVGLTTLETLSFAVDPTTQGLIARRGILFAASPTPWIQDSPM